MCTACLSRRRFLQGAVLAAPLATAGCDLPILVSEAEAAEMGREAWAAILQRTPVSNAEGEVAPVRRAAAKLLAAGGHDAREWEVAVFATDTVNAFALPGRKIGIHRGMLRLAGAEDRLAAVIGHEIGHIEAAHSRERMSAQAAGNALVQLVRWLLNMGQIEFAAEIAGALGVGLEFGVLRPYGRGQEEEADILGLGLMRRAGYRPEAALELWQRMDARGGRGPEFLSTHPAPQSRIRTLQEAIAAQA
ncbi:M48 family metallopeptidase [Jannaschia sp. W003]|uniref:M48 family metallopeptidase n=1 Tax=Jannaschia sp. W003 TaxID=2867012 RepID=UPI0021A63138|nr:M48 family metallopeptidase [Jannaschia sp. W003]UWQ21600.1 M48 family metallopeptidase [Jannaschia sp. W003]